jgi:hypothetical protein
MVVMRRRSHEFQAASFALEGRMLLAVGHALASAASKFVQFAPASGAATGLWGTPQTEMVGQQDGVAYVKLARSGNMTGKVQVQVTTDPSSPAVGTNVGPVNQTVTFADAQSQAVVTVPIFAGAPNAGEVDVNLDITPVGKSSRVSTSGPLTLKILASDATLPPKIVSTTGTSQGIVLTFSKPMDPATASNVNNYAVRATRTSVKSSGLLGALNVLTFPFHTDNSGFGTSSSTSRPVPIQAADYDPASNSVILVPKRRVNFSAGLIVTQAKAGAQSNPVQALTDIQGHPINLDTTPGKFSVPVVKGLRPTP